MRENTFHTWCRRRFLLAAAVAFGATLTLPALAQEISDSQAGVDVSDKPAQVNGMKPPAEYVSIHVDGGDMRQVLNSFSMQTKRNIVIGPEVASTNVTIHLNNVQWENALDVILKPYGYGYRQVGDATVVGELSRLKALETVEPLQSRIYELKYLDANDVDRIIQGMLSPRGSHNIITAEARKGWKDLAQKGRTSRIRQSSGVSLEMRTRDEEETRSKTLVITDVPSVLDAVTETLQNLDKMPSQVLIQARFVEVNQDLLRDIGVEWNGSLDIGEAPVGYAQEFFNDEPNAFQALSGDLDANGALPSSFGRLGISSGSWEMFISMIQEDEDTKTLSAPRILTMNNREAAFIVGQKYPIIESEISTQNNTPTKSVRLEYYESIGVQLNVVPQICAGGYINMMVRPTVTAIESFIEPLEDNLYPVIKVRDAETQVMAADGETIVIGGLLEEREANGVFKVPFIGDIPYLGRLFRRDTKDTKTIDLLIFITATVVDENNYDLIIEKEEVPPAVIELIEPEILVIPEVEPVELESMEPAEEKSVEDIMAELNAE